MSMKQSCFKKRRGEGTPLTIAIVLVLLMLFCVAAERSRLWIISQGVKEAVQQAVISTINDNYDDVYHAAREGYTAGWYPTGGSWEESLDPGDLYLVLSRTLGLTTNGVEYMKYAGAELEYTLSSLSVTLPNNSLGSGLSNGFTADAKLTLEIPVRFLGKLLPPVHTTLKVQAKYVPLF